MFVPGTACIRVKRKEPEIRSLAHAREIAKRRNSLVAEKAITIARLNKKPNAKSRERIAKAWEKDKRLDYVQPFIIEFNRWREFYMEDTSEWLPKNSSQITCIENIIELCQEKNIDIGLLIGCSFKSLAWKPAAPLVTQILSRGLENYERYIDDVLCDLDERQNMEDAYE